MQFAKLHANFFFIVALHQIFTRWHYNETLTLTLILTLKITVMYAVKDDTEIKLHLVLETKVISLGTVGFIKGLYTANGDQSKVPTQPWLGQRRNSDDGITST